MSLLVYAILFLGIGVGMIFLGKYLLSKVSKKQAVSAETNEKEQYYSVTLTDVGCEKVKVIKVIRETSGASLSEAKNLTGHTPSVILKCCTAMAADKLMNDLASVGAQSRKELYQTDSQSEKDAAEILQKKIQEQNERIQERNDRQYFDIVLTDAGTEKETVIQLICKYSIMEVKEAKELAEHTPAVIMECGSAKMTEQLCKELEASGAQYRKDVNAFGIMLNNYHRALVLQEQHNNKDDVAFLSVISETAKELENRVITALKKQSQIYVLMDEDYKTEFEMPYIGLDGRIEVFTSLMWARLAVQEISKRKAGHVRIKKFLDVNSFFEMIQYLGIHYFRINNGMAPVDIRTADLEIPFRKNLIDQHNAVERGLFIRWLQYGYRLKNMDDAEKGSGFEKMLIEYMETMRLNGYREIGNNMSYVLATMPEMGDMNTSWYTPNALKWARETALKNNLPDTVLMADGTNRLAEFTGPLDLQTLRYSADAGLGDSWVCASTGYQEAKGMNAEMQSFGVNNLVIVAVTFDELYMQACKCAGIELDSLIYGLKLTKDDFANILKWRDMNQVPIVVNVKNSNSLNQE
ncbi:MAG: ribosomal protein L7/L12 [Eubacteriales bacterium]|nr:ribosomal protein L7/L12 [Eubacteriales bacterium]